MSLGIAAVVAAALLAGPAAAGATTIDLGHTAGSVRITGGATNDESGSALSSAGDVNGDGRDDVIVGAPLADGSSRHDAGSAFVVYGGRRSGNLNLGTLGSAGFRIDGARKNDHAGWSVAGAGDVNGDGIDDVIVGAPGADDHGRTGSGAAYVIYGRHTADPGNVDLAKLTTSQATRGMRVDGASAGDAAGTAVSGAHDLNFDQRADVMVGAPHGDNNGRRDAGAAYALYGRNTADPADVDLARIVTAERSRGALILGAAAGDEAGSSLAVTADMNGDGVGDAIIGAPQADPGSRTSAGSAYIVYGQKTADLADFDLAGIAGSPAGMRIDGAVDADLAGQSVAGGRDLNGDGIGDAIVGAPFADNNDRVSSGSAYVVYGVAADAADVDLAQITTGQAARGMRIDGAAPDDRAGTAVAAAGDLSGDGRPDALVGAPFASNRARAVSGSAYGIYGQATADPPDVDLAKINGTQSSRGFRVDGATAGEGEGFALAGGNVIGNPRQDAIIGGVGGEDFAGTTYLLNVSANLSA